jgi:hypothetical protein
VLLTELNIPLYCIKYTYFHFVKHKCIQKRGINARAELVCYVSKKNYDTWRISWFFLLIARGININFSIHLFLLLSKLTVSHMDVTWHFMNSLVNGKASSAEIN